MHAVAEAKTKRPAMEGWLTLDAAAPRLLGTRCRACGSVFFPKEAAFCRNPACAGTGFDEVPLSRRGTLWSYTDNRYAPPAPYVAADPFVPYAVAAVELADEKLVVLGQVAPGVRVEDLEVGMEMELTLGTLYSDAEHEFLIWHWKPAA
jgi:uncharacterized OB-fold protein